MLGFKADDGVGGGGSKVFAMVLRTVGESVSVMRLRLGRLAWAVDNGGRVVWRESLGLLNVGGRVGGMAESMVSVTCFRTSAVSGDSERGEVEVDSGLA